MPTTYTGSTGTGQVTNLVQTMYDRLVEHQLRAQPLFRNFADKRPVDVTGPAATVTLNLWTDMVAVTTALTENVDPDPVALGNTTPISITLAEYGNIGLTTRKMELVALADVEVEVAQQIGWNMIDSLDIITQGTIVGKGTNVFYTSGTTPTVLAANSGATYTAGSGCTAIAAGNITNSTGVRYAVTKLRALKVQPRKGNLYGCLLAPEASADLRAETGAAAWRDPHVYSGNDASQQMIWAGEIGAYEGAFYIESPRVFSQQIGAGGTVRVFNNYFFGQQFLAEAVGQEPHIEFGPFVDALNRMRRIGWYGFLGWAPYRADALVNYEVATIARPTT